MGESSYEWKWRTTEANEHIERLALEHDVSIIWGEHLRALSHSDHRMIWTPSCTSGTKYLCALHELGHVIDPRSSDWCRKAEAKPKQGRQYDRSLNWLGESAAWVWAFQHIDVRLGDDLLARDFRHVAACWVSYGKEMVPGFLVA